MAKLVVHSLAMSIDGYSLHLAVRPILLGSGENLFEGIDMRALGYECAESADGERATHVLIHRRA
jgi:hypothetical protein